MKKVLLLSSVIMVVLLILSFNLSDDKPKGITSNNANQTIDSKQIDGNNIRTWFRSNGSFNRDPVTGDSGFEWPKGSNKFARYASGLWLGGVVGNDTLVAIAEYNSEYLPGYIDDNGNPQGKDDPNYKMYKIAEGDSTSSGFVSWPVNQGAYINSAGKPYLLGQQTLFCSFTDGYPESHSNSSGSTGPLKAVVLKTSWCYADSIEGPLSNTIFTEFRIINRGSLTWTKFYIALWTDDDLGDGNDDAAGCDTILDLAYTYNFDNIDPFYGTAPPAANFLLLKGPVVQSSGDTAKYFNPPGSNTLIIKPSHKIERFSSFMPYYSGDPSAGDPANNREVYFNLQGIRRNGTVWANPQTGLPSKFPYSGDPESNTGWRETNSGDRRYMASIGPLNMNPSDTQSIIVAQIITKGINNLNSVTRLKKFSKIIKTFYENNFKYSVDRPPSPLVTSYAPGNGKIYLSWNDSAEKISIKNPFSDGTYKFQGYNIYQIRTNNFNPSSNDTVLIKSFDIKDGITNIYDSVYINQYEGIVYGIVKRGTDNGIARFLVVEKDTFSNNEFVNGTEYKFAVTAYYYDPRGGIFALPKVLETEKLKGLVKIIPQSLTPGAQVNYGLGDTIRTDQKDLGVMPIIFRPLDLVSATYTSTIGQTVRDTTWTLTKTANGITSILFENVTDFSGLQDTAKIVDGFLLVHRHIKDSGIVRDPETKINVFQYPFYVEYSYPNNQRAWTYEPEGKEWFTGPDTTAINFAKTINGRQFESRSLGMSFPTFGTFKNTRSRIFANGKSLQPGTGSNTLLTGGPLRKIQIVFGQSSMAYRYIPTDTNLNSTPYVDMVNIPYSAFAIDELDSSNGSPRQLNVGFLDNDNDGIWNPDTSKLGNYHFTYIFASDYSSIPNPQLITKNPGLTNPVQGFPGMDIMYVWLPRVKAINGVPQRWSDGDTLTVSPYRITRPEFVPGYPVKYSWTVKGTETSNIQLASTKIDQIKAFPNPYFGSSELEYNSGGEKFIYFSHLPSNCNIHIYTLDGVLVKKIERSQSDPTNTLEKWDLKNSDGKYVASGMYIIYVDCKEVGVKTLKIAVFQNKF